MLIEGAGYSVGVTPISGPHFLDEFVTIQSVFCMDSSIQTVSRENSAVSFLERERKWCKVSGYLCRITEVETKTILASWHLQPRPNPSSLPATSSAFYRLHAPNRSITLSTSPIMSSTPKQRLQALSEHLTTKSTDPATTEDLPKIRRIAPNSAGPYLSPHPLHSAPTID